MDVEFKTVNGARLAYRFDGPAGAPVVMLGNSLAASMAMWQPQLAALGAWRVLRCDVRGHGASEATPAPYTLVQLADDAIGLLDALGLAQVHFVGLSMGGMIGQVLGARHADRLLSLALCDTASDMRAMRAAWDERIAIARRDGMAAIAGPTLQRWFTPAFFERSPQAVQAVREMIERTPIEGYAGCASAVRDLNQSPLLRDIAVRTTVIAGELDPACTPAQARELQSQIPGASLRLLADCAHLPNIEQPAAFDEALLAHLNRS
ncbi:MAG: 3-oxoadipate enol-lactonase [Burkholderiaceae bacterium]